MTALLHAATSQNFEPNKKSFGHVRTMRFHQGNMPFRRVPNTFFVWLLGHTQLEVSICEHGRQDPRLATRSGFSLLEVMLATAILASSALVLSSLLGLGAKFGSRAEARTEALAQAQSLLDEFLALPSRQTEQQTELTGIINSNPARGYRIRMQEASPTSLHPGSGGNNQTANAATGPMLPIASAISHGEGTSTPVQPPPGRLMLVTVEVFESANTEPATDQPALCHLVKLCRAPANAP